jgi:hypothetical protein
MNGSVKFSRIPAWASDVELTEMDWRVLHAICLHADKTGRAYPSLTRIAQIARMHRKHVPRSTKRLEQLGLLRSERVSRGSGWANTHYQVIFDRPEEVSPGVGLPKSTGVPWGGDRVSPGVGAEVSPGVVH